MKLDKVQNLLNRGKPAFMNIYQDPGHTAMAGERLNCLLQQSVPTTVLHHDCANVHVHEFV